LDLVARIHDGFRLAEEDLKLRGSGNLFGREQSGDMTFRVARMTDLRLMAAAKEEAEKILKESAGDLSKFPVWKERVKRLQETSHLE
jgi:ATP-dependent DNA helicase RecG